MRSKSIYKKLFFMVCLCIFAAVLSVLASAEEFEKLQIGAEKTVKGSNYVKYEIDIPYDGYFVLSYEGEGSYSYYGKQVEINILNYAGEKIYPKIESPEIGYLSSQGVSDLSAYIDYDKNIGKAKGTATFKFAAGVKYLIVDTDDKSEWFKFSLTHEHVYESTVTSQATCSKEGERMYSCTCGDTYTEKIPITSHREVMDSGKPATCMETGLTDGYHCADCGKVTVAQSEIPMTDHLYDASYEITKKPDCKNTGTVRFYCVCGKYTDEELDTTSHQPVEDKEIEPTCKSEGKSAGSHCSVCGEVLEPQKSIPALEHVEVTDIPKDPTCAEEGKTIGSHCALCGEVIKPQESIPVTNEHILIHVPAKEAEGNNEATIEHWRCTICSKLFADKDGHTQIESAVNKPSGALVIILVVVFAVVAAAAVTGAVILIKKKKQ